MCFILETVRLLETMLLTENIAYIALFHAKENAVNQKPGKQLKILRYATDNMQRMVFHFAFPSLLARDSYIGVLSRTPQN